MNLYNKYNTQEYLYLKFYPITADEPCLIYPNSSDSYILHSFPNKQIW